jgi:hypothetical protein
MEKLYHSEKELHGLSERGYRFEGEKQNNQEK